MTSLIRMVTFGLRFPCRSILIRPARSSLRNALLFASGCMPQASSIRLETMKVFIFRSPLMCQRANPTNNAFTPSWPAWHIQETGMGPAINLFVIGKILRPRRVPRWECAIWSNWRLLGSQLKPLLLRGDIIGYLTYTHFSTTTSAFRYNTQNLRHRLLAPSVY